MKKVFVSHNLDEAYRIRDALRDEGIDANVTNEALIGAWGGTAMDLSTLPTVWIADETLVVKADELVKRVLQPVDRGPWTCAQCGVRNGGAFTDCPSCGAARPDEEGPEGEQA